MRKILVVMALVLASGAASAETKIGFVNMKTLLEDAPQFQEINKSLQDRFGTSKKELDEMRDALQKQNEENKRNEVLMTEAKANKAKQEFAEKVQEFREKEQKLAGEVQAFRNSELAKLDKVVRELVKELAEKKKIDLIINDGVMYVDEKVDLTKDLLDRLKKAQAEKK